MAMYVCHNPNFRAVECVDCRKPPLQLNGFFIWTVQIESKVKTELSVVG